MRARLCVLGAAVVTLAACTDMGQGASAELASLFRFAEYPNGKLVSESISRNNVGPFGAPGNYGSRLYETNDNPTTIRLHYENLGKQHGWVVSDKGSAELDTRYEGIVAQLARERFQFTVSVTPTMQVLQGPYYGPVPARPPEPSPSPSPGATPAPTPTPHTGPWYVRIDANATPF